ncbi:hypothetical protein TIFTF001_027891 [Ficus carica]|uniref:Uncharacterized protein n=1 Tax=Ficus carica TaxID=3494 RepID=A0AA88DNV2_FICCA|nr:hypothetical protein TIFTF001_027891 [Ficus carica]
MDLGELAIGGGWPVRPARLVVGGRRGWPARPGSSRLVVDGPRGRRARDWRWLPREVGKLAIGGGWPARPASSRSALQSARARDGDDGDGTETRRQ